MTFLVTSCHWHICHLILNGTVNDTIHFLGKDNQNEVQHGFFDNLIHWYCHQHNMMPITSSVTPVDSLGQDGKIEVQHHFCGHVTPLVLTLASHDADGTVNGTILFLRSR